ncbi:hypothetical protein BGZ60DRAFT_516683 [Tricladium varicosporioides]|nr:hypothetical protein BGZ60DRAFT_516683 [Hymenoscyphus varicosporioides]
MTVDEQDALNNAEDVAVNAAAKARGERYRLNAEIKDLQEQRKKVKSDQNTKLLECLEHQKKFEAQSRGFRYSINGDNFERDEDSTDSKRLTHAELTRPLEELQRQLHIDEEGIPVVMIEGLEILRQQLKEDEEKCKEEKKKSENEKDNAARKLQEATD